MFNAPLRSLQMCENYATRLDRNFSKNFSLVFLVSKDCYLLVLEKESISYLKEHKTERFRNLIKAVVVKYFKNRYTLFTFQYFYSITKSHNTKRERKPECLMNKNILV